MTQETIVAAFDTAAEAQAAARDVEAAGIPASSISTHADNAPTSGLATSTTTTTGTTAARHEPGFWAKLFGVQEDYRNDTGTYRDQAVYGHTMESGGAVLTISIQDAERDGDRILSIIEAHNPVDVEERGAAYAGSTTTVQPVTAAYSTGAATAPVAPVAGEGQTVQLSEEELLVGKRIVTRGTTRIRRYVVETPVSENVSLRDETVAIERRPVTGRESVGPDAFTDKTIEVTEQGEEAVVGKTAHVVEEVAIRKDVNDRVETVHDTVRREQLEVEKVDETGKKLTP